MLIVAYSLGKKEDIDDELNNTLLYKIVSYFIKTRVYQFICIQVVLLRDEDLHIVNGIRVEVLNFVNLYYVICFLNFIHV